MNTVIATVDSALTEWVSSMGLKAECAHGMELCTLDKATYSRLFTGLMVHL